ncbi:universal stress protein [Streptomyces sp. LP11]|uniref:Universal stress protein n=1 Tax=Streptomyces pyxinicus TaxID=2970331 RepID=A0ABT2B3L9_9ACTN|nr:universal stress protein [Streptomyces sp. LP11]MCS0603113.1 universal stress protein [Streptomyces sp. LP11]
MSDPVVVGVDGSASALDAVETAAHEAELRGTGLRLVHAFGWPPAHPPHAGPPWYPGSAGMRELVDGTLAAAEERARAAAPGTALTREVTVGAPLTVLEIESRAAALLVVGSRGLGGFGSLLLGSTAVHLAAYGRCPVLVARGRPNPDGPVLLAVDGSPAGAAAVEFAFAAAELHRAPLVALHVWNTWSEPAHDGPDSPLDVVVNLDRLREEERRTLDETVLPFQALRPGVAVERRLVRSRIRPALIDASREARLTVTGARGRGGFTGLLLGSVSQALLHHAHGPVAVVRGDGRA